MVTGFNTEVEHRGKVFHVQTEDKGEGNPTVETLIYCGGEIVTSRRSSYAELAEGDGFTEEMVLERMEAQHQALIRAIKNGKFDIQKPFGHKFVTNRSLDDVVLKHLEVEEQASAIQLKVVSWESLLEGSSPRVTVRVVTESDKSAVPDAQVVVQLIPPEGKATELFQGASDPEGLVEACFEIPLGCPEGTEVLCLAVTPDSRDELRQPVKSSDGSPRTS